MENCKKCNKELDQNSENTYLYSNETLTHWICKDCYESLNSYLFKAYKEFMQPERSKREDLECKNCLEVLKNLCWKIDPIEMGTLLDNKNYSKMRCSEHCGNTVRDK